MNTVEDTLIDTLIDLSINYNVNGVKAEFEAEGTRLEELLRLKDVVSKANLELTIKIGGAEAYTDLYNAKLVGVDKIVAPMIETQYALKKYLEMIKKVYNEEEREFTKFLINVETITSVNDFSKMLELGDIALLSGIVVGRVDLTGSMGLTREDINSKLVLEATKQVFKLAKEKNLSCIVGGGVTSESYNFFQNLGGLLDTFETRKIIFKKEVLKDRNKTEEGILKAVGFELMWLKNKKNMYGSIYKEDDKRIELLENRYNSLLAQHYLA